MSCKARIPSWRSTSSLFLLASFLNVSFCVVGGLLLYLDSIDQIEKGVAEISGAELQLNADRLSKSFTDVYWVSNLYAHQLLANGTEGMSDPDTLQNYYERLQLSTLVHSDSMYSISTMIAPLGPNAIYEPAGLLQLAWWDPLTDPATIAKYDGRNRVWITGTYLPQYYNESSCRKDPVEFPPTRRRCVVCYSVDPYGRRLENVYNYSDKNIYKLQSGSSSHWEESMVGWETQGATFWRSLSVWESEDGTKYGYATFARILPKLTGPMFTGAKIALMTYVSFYGWFDRIEESEATMMATTMANGLDSQVLASNINLNYLRSDCQSNRESGERGRAFCLYKLSELPAAFSQAALILNETAYNAFRSATLDGERYWVRRVSIFASRDVDLLDSIDLLWMRKHSTVQDKVKRALLQFVLFAVGAAVLSIVVLVLLVLGISVPLHKVTTGLKYLDDMELEIAEDLLPPIRTMQVIEVSKLVKSVKVAIHSLKMYRDFLPQSCLEIGGAEEDEVATEGTVPKQDSVGTMSAMSTTKKSIAQRGGAQSSIRSGASSATSRAHANDLGNTLRAALSAELEQRTVTVAVVNVVNFHTEDGGPAKYKQLLTFMIQNKADGVVDGCFGDRCRVSWNGARIVASQRTRAGIFAEKVRSSNHPRLQDQKPLLVSIGVATGPGKCGVAGCDGVRYFTVIGTHVSFAYLMERLARRDAAHRSESVAVLPRMIMEDVSINVHCRFFMQVAYRKNRAVTALFETTGLADSGGEPNEEWMYILGDADTSIWGAYNEAAKQACAGAVEGAIQVVEERLKGKEDTPDGKVYAAFLARLQSGLKDESLLPTKLQEISDEPLPPISAPIGTKAEGKAAVTEL
eukprot:TRINITY_DN2494_c1_g1_i1.p1 TRINITY_DN2494_c1_g1~~TRINITY_DN2494_c1_g1_i1.p1  ORF type:complete len:861 (+),score=290.02 TRINITY_DN2494_c1_g1_i1:128-2710(+)